MEKIPYSFALLLAASVILFSSCGTGGASVESVEINGVHWATHNVDTSGTFTRNPESAGGIFTWEEAQSACPQGWRVPTSDELRALNRVRGDWTMKNGVNGRFFGTYPHQIFLPAGGWRNRPNSAVRYVGSDGHYWSSDATFHYLWFNSGNVSVRVFDRTDAGRNVRCVAE